jgi:hypothetical protein
MHWKQYGGGPSQFGDRGVHARTELLPSVIELPDGRSRQAVDVHDDWLHFVAVPCRFLARITGCDLPRKSTASFLCPWHLDFVQFPQLFQRVQESVGAGILVIKLCRCAIDGHTAGINYCAHDSGYDFLCSRGREGREQTGQ